MGRRTTFKTVLRTLMPALFALTGPVLWIWSRIHSRTDPLPGFPSLILWAWEEPQDLRFLDPSQAGVAYLAETITVRANGAFLLRPRVQPLRVAANSKIMSVVRIENPALGAYDPDALANAILRPQVLTGASALQIDYDAAQSERSRYSALLTTLRHRMPPEMPLTITALVSWCAAGRSLDQLPVADAVPMYFRMGMEQRLRTAPLSASICQNSTGLSADEPIQIALHRRIFLFSPRSWNAAVLSQALFEIHRRL